MAGGLLLSQPLPPLLPLLLLLVWWLGISGPTGCKQAGFGLAKLAVGQLMRRTFAGTEHALQLEVPAELVPG